MALLEKINILNRINIDDLTNSFLGMDRRMQVLTTVGAVLGVLLLIFLPMIFISSLLSGKETEYVQHMETVADFYDAASEYSALNTRIGSLQEGSALANKKLSDVIYDLADKSGIVASRIKLNQATQILRTGETFTEIGQDGKVLATTLESIVNFLEQIDKTPGGMLKVRKLEMKVDPRNKQALREVAFTISMMKLNKEKEAPSE
jgi:hypothetical protein